MTWWGVWGSGYHYPRGSVVESGSILYIANKRTDESPSPTAADWDVLLSSPDLSGYLELTGGTMTGAIEFSGYDVSGNAFVFDVENEGAYMSWDDGIGGNRLTYFGYTKANSKAVLNIKDSSNLNQKRYDFTPSNADEDNTVLRRIDADARYVRPDIAATFTQNNTFDNNQFFTGGLGGTTANGGLAKFGNAELSIQAYQSSGSRYIGFIPRNTGDTGNIWGSRLAWDEAQQAWCIGTAPIATTALLQSLESRIATLEAA